MDQVVVKINFKINRRLRHEKNLRPESKCCDNLLAAKADSRAGKVLVRKEGVKGHFVVREFPTETLT